MVVSKPQVSKETYAAGKYAELNRFGSYFYQVRELLKTRPRSILEIGVGDGVVSNHVRTQTDIEYTTADHAADLKPDVVADIRELPFKDGSFDTVCAFEVLEHLPFEDFEKGVGELARVARNYVVISLPHFGPPIKLLFKIPFLPEIKLAWKVPYHPTHIFNGRHYWEIGKKGYPPSRIRAIAEKYGTLVNEFVPFENQYHHFFVIQKNR